ncbi:MAG: cysteine desulfurase [Candidatus Melainabacteria bacterium]|nr:cysteine desulfurase [Candidatus Melainabacteria bacterium]MBI3307905.1 cysteine desulfurase [Candidatus Melainabacteria bacterium]
MKRIIYADHSATTPPRKEVIDAILPLLNKDFGNPSSIHSLGIKAKSYLANAKKDIANIINASPEEIIFTSGGTESNNTVIFGIQKLIEDKKLNKEKHIITSSIEHPSIKAPIEYLGQKGWKITWLKVNSEGFIDINELKSAISDHTALVTIIHANNEIGTTQDLKTISLICKNHNVLFHTDAVQSFCKIPIDAKSLNLDFMSMSSHKIYGLKGSGGLYINKTCTLAPLILGGGQENNLRSGTENLPGIVGFSTSAKLLNSEISDTAQKLRKLQINLIKGLEKLIENHEILITGPSLSLVKENIPNEKYLHRLPGHVSFCCKDLEGESLVLQANLLGIAISSGSACASQDSNKIGSFEPSHIIKAIDIPIPFQKGSLRISLGRENTDDDVTYILDTIFKIIEKLKSSKV